MKGHESRRPTLADAADASAAATHWRLARPLWLAGLVAFCGVLAFLGGFATFATHVGNLTMPADPRPADAIIVLTGGSARIDTGVGLLKAGKGERLLISGVNPMADVEDLRRATGGDRDLFACCVDIDHDAQNTIGNAEESAKWVMRHSFASVILVTNNYHMPRSLMEMRRFLGDADLQPYPVVNRRLDGGEWIRRPGAVRVLFTEYVKYLGSFVRGVVNAGSIRAQVAALPMAVEGIIEGP